MKPDAIGVCVYILFYKKWGRTLVAGQLRSKLWWVDQLKTLIEAPAITIPQHLLTDWEPKDKPIPYETEMGLDKKKEE